VSYLLLFFCAAAEPFSSNLLRSCHTFLTPFFSLLRKEEGKIETKVEFEFKNWLCHEFPDPRYPAAQSASSACWYYQDDRRDVLHPCYPATVEQLERHYAANQGKSIQHHKFEMEVPFRFPFKGQMVHGNWIFEAVSISPTSDPPTLFSAEIQPTSAFACTYHIDPPQTCRIEF
jgi:hypothetical protein